MHLTKVTQCCVLLFSSTSGFGTQNVSIWVNKAKTLGSIYLYLCCIIEPRQQICKYNIYQQITFFKKIVSFKFRNGNTCNINLQCFEFQLIVYKCCFLTIFFTNLDIHCYTRVHIIMFKQFLVLFETS